MELAREGEQKWETQVFSCERNEMFLAVARDFLAMVRGQAAVPACTLEDGREVLRLVDACRQSQSTGRLVTIAEVKA